MDNKILSIQNISFETLGTLRELIRSDGYQVENIEAQKEAVPNNAEQYEPLLSWEAPWQFMIMLSILKGNRS